MDTTAFCEPLYCDTDSVIYLHPDDVDPLPAGKGHLGEMTDETPDHHIVEFISGGCKNYGLKVKKKEGNTNEYEHWMKIRGFFLDGETSQILDYTRIKRNIFSYGTKKQKEPISVTYPNSLRPNISKGSVFTVPITKKYDIVVTKGIIDHQTLTILPYGYRKNCI